MDKKNLEIINNNYKFACNDILNAFIREYNLDSNTKYWVCDTVGGTAMINEEYFFTVEEMLLMLNNNILFDEYLKFVDYNTDCDLLGLNTMDLKSWIKGSPRYPKERIEKLKEMRKNLSTLIEQTKEELMINKSNHATFYTKM